MSIGQECVWACEHVPFPKEVLLFLSLDPTNLFHKTFSETKFKVYNEIVKD